MPTPQPQTPTSDNPPAPAAPAAAAVTPAAPAAEPASPSPSAPGNGAAGEGGEGGTDGGAGATPGDWKAGLGADVLSSPSLQHVKSVEDLAQQFIASQSYIGNSIRIPSEDASAEDKKAFRAKLKERVPGLAEVTADDAEALTATMRQLGAPEDAKGYKLPEFEGDQSKMVPLEGFNEWAHEANMTQGQFETVARRFTEAQMAQREEKAVVHNAEMEALHTEWGYAYDDKRTQAINTAKLTGMPDDFIAALEADRVPAAWMKSMAGLAERFGPDGSIGDRRPARGELTPSEAQAQHDEIMNNREHPYWKALVGSPEKQRAVEKVLMLKEKAMGQGAREPAAVFGHHD